jgi:hypothetical protein
MFDFYQPFEEAKEIMSAKNEEVTNGSSGLMIAKAKVFDKCGLEMTELKEEKESKEYSAHTFCLNGLSVLYREAKTTPTKAGQFVTLWKRNNNKIIEPFESTDKIDLVIINTYKEDNAGQFIFTKQALLNNKVFTHESKEGKRAIRVYPPWEKELNKQAQKTQQWQLECFLETADDKPLEMARALTLILNE